MNISNYFLNIFNFFAWFSIGNIFYSIQDSFRTSSFSIILASFKTVLKVHCLQFAWRSSLQVGLYIVWLLWQSSDCFGNFQVCLSFFLGSYIIPPITYPPITYPNWFYECFRSIEQLMGGGTAVSSEHLATVDKSHCWNSQLFWFLIDNLCKEISAVFQAAPDRTIASFCLLSALAFRNRIDGRGDAYLVAYLAYRIFYVILDVINT